MKPGVMDWVLMEKSDVPMFEKAKRLGFQGIEVCLKRSELRNGNGRLQSLKIAKDRTGVQIPSLVLGEHNNGGIGSADPKVVEEAEKDIRQTMDWAKELGAKVILIPFFMKGELNTDAEFDRAVDAFKKLCPLAKERGLRLAYEGVLSAKQMAQLAERVGSDVLGCYFDLANVVWRGMDSATEIRELGNLVFQVHLKECRVGPLDCQPGTGRVDYLESAKALKEIGYDEWLVFETQDVPAELIARDVSFAKSVFPNLQVQHQWPQFGAFSYDFKKGEIDRMIQEFKKNGLIAVQLGGELLQECLDDSKKISEFRSKLDQAGIRVIGIAGYRNLVTPDEKKRKENIEFLKRCLEIAPQLGTSIVATETGTRCKTSDWEASPENWDGSTWDLLCDAIQQLLTVAEKNGTIVALEGYVNNVLQTVGQAIALLEKFPSKNLQLVLDPFNYMSSHLLPAKERFVRDFLNRFESRFVIAHLKDVSPEGAEKGTPEFGQGVFPAKIYFDFLKAKRPDLAIILEHLPWESVPTVIKKAKDLMK
jgi:sugar phosphate isomerase/epimerase